VGKIDVNDEIMIENHKKTEHMEIKEIIHKYTSKRSFRNGIHSLLSRADSRESTDIIYLIM